MMEALGVVRLDDKRQQRRMGRLLALHPLPAIPDRGTEPAQSVESRHLVHEEDGRTYVYRASRPRERAGTGAFRRVLDVFFGGSLEQAVAAHLGESLADLDEAELKRLAGLIQQARKARKENES